ncbi:MAG: hypothetical protein AB8B55_04385 [Mariniblastus sp.]
MFIQSLKVAFVVAAVSICGTVSAQDCGGCSSGSVMYGGAINYASAGQTGFGDNSCGRAITQNQAASLWAGYCNESCDTGGGRLRGCGLGKRIGGCGVATAPCNMVSDGCGFVDSGAGGCGLGGGCKLGGKLRGLFSGIGGGMGAGCGCDMGCFGYPTGGGCGSAGGFGGGLFSGLGGKLRGKFAGGCGCGGGCSLFSGNQGGKLRGLFNGGCGGGCFGGKLRGLFGGCGSKFQASAGHCGSTGAYFSEAVGYEYGTSGMQSCVSGCATNACGNGMNYGVSAVNFESNNTHSIMYGNGVQGTPLQTGEVYMGNYDPTANAKEIPGEAVTGGSNAADAVEKLQDAAGQLDGN